MNVKKYFLASSIIARDLLGQRSTLKDHSQHITQAMKWLSRAQDMSGSGGVSEGYHLYHGWLPPYPETTGYIIETFFDYSHLFSDTDAKERAVRMTEWLMSIQNPDGSIPDSYLKKSMVFDTGQVLFGFTRCYAETGDQRYLSASVRAGDWLLREQEPDGTWIRNAVDRIPHAYYSRVAWGLIKLYEASGKGEYLDAAVKNIEWVLRRQNDLGWFDNASFNLVNHACPYTHTIAYTMRGVLETGIFLKESRFIDAITKTVEHIVQVMPGDGRLAGSYGSDWNGDNTFTCLTGNAQLSIVMRRLFEVKRDERWLTASRRINSYMKSMQELRVDDQDVLGAMAGSSPIWGRYIHYTYPNWAVKFFADSLMLEGKNSM